MILKGIKDKIKVGAAAPAGEAEPAPAAASRLRPGIADYVAGEQKAFATKLYPFRPQELMGGAIPHIPGAEDEAVWNAAAQACATERVHYCYSVEDGRIWFLATPSAAIASNPTKGPDSS